MGRGAHRVRRTRPGRLPGRRNNIDRSPRSTAAAPVSLRGRRRPLVGDRRWVGGDSRSTWPSRRRGSGDLPGRHRDHRQPRRQIDLSTSTSRSGRTRPHARQTRPDAQLELVCGHSATSFAFAYTIGRHLPFVGIPIRLLAAAVAYSRVHIGVHYPGDVIIGSIMGAGTAAAIGSAWDHRRP